MGTWSANGLYIVGKDQLDERKAAIFAHQSVSEKKDNNNLYD